MSRRLIARATTSRGARSASGCSSAMKATPCSSRRIAPSPRSASESSGRGIDGWCSAVGWNCMNSRSATATPARSAMAMPSPVDSGGVRGDGEALPRTTGRDEHVAGTDRGGTVGAERGDADAPVAFSTRRSEASQPSRTSAPDPAPRPPAPARSRRRWRRRLRARPGPRSGRLRAARAKSSRPSAGRSARRARSARGRGRALRLASDAHRVGVAEAAAGGEGVGAVQLGRVVGRVERRGHPTLRVAGGRPAELALGETVTDRPARRARTAAESPATPLPSTRRSATRFGTGGSDTESFSSGGGAGYGATSRTAASVGWLCSSTCTTPGS